MCGPEKQIPNDQVADHANEFRTAAKVLRRHLGLGPDSSVPAILVNAALSLELYLKSLNAKNVYEDTPEGIGCLVTAEWDAPRDPATGKKLKVGHLLTVIYDHFMPEVKTALETDFAEWPVRGKTASFRDALLPYAETFVSWRYIFEGKGTNPQERLDGILALVEFLAGFVERHLRDVFA